MIQWNEIVSKYRVMLPAVSYLSIKTILRVRRRKNDLGLDDR